MATACSCSGPGKDYIRVQSCLSKGNVLQIAGCHMSMMQIWIVNVGPDQCGALSSPHLLPKDF